MGSDSFSLPVLESLLDCAPALDLLPVGVVTAPDNPAGRGRRITTGPVKMLAEAREIDVQQPSSFRDPGALLDVASWRPDLIVVASYGQILPGSLLNVPAHGCLNLHPSLLPRLRGPSPVAGAILDGLTVTGTTLMKMVRKMDGGPILAQTETPIGEGETSGQLSERLAHLSAELFVSRLPAWLSGSLKPLPQDDGQATYTRRITKDDGQVDWSQPADLIARRVRAFNPWPIAHARWGSRDIRLYRARAAEGEAEPGEVIGLDGTGLLVGTGHGLLAVSELQLAGSRVLGASDVVRGHPDLVGSALL